MYPGELYMVGYAPEKWKPADSLAVVRLMSWHGMASMQGDVEILIMQAIQKVRTYTLCFNM
tara:strand:+ start:132 stop:314 length:183 start_codon:yes stop_codon:yes gene_type:complete